MRKITRKQVNVCVVEGGFEGWRFEFLISTDILLIIMSVNDFMTVRDPGMQENDSVQIPKFRSF